MKVIITKSGFNPHNTWQPWYSDKVGQIFEVDSKIHNRYYQVLSTGNFIDIKNCMTLSYFRRKNLEKVLNFKEKFEFSLKLFIFYCIYKIWN